MITNENLLEIISNKINKLSEFIDKNNISNNTAQLLNIYTMLINYIQLYNNLLSIKGIEKEDKEKLLEGLLEKL
jgi:hypothetical protein